MRSLLSTLLLAHVAVGELTAKYKILEYSSKEKGCMDNERCVSIYALSNGTFQDAWTCWKNAPRRCWYQMSMILNGTIPPEAICKTANNDWVVGMSTLHPAFVVPGPVVSGEAYIHFATDILDQCKFNVTEAPFRGVGLDGSPYGDCEVETPNPDSVIPLSDVMAEDRSTVNISSHVADYIMTSHSNMVIHGLDPDVCGVSVEGIEFVNWKQEMLFYGTVGEPVATTYQPTTTAPSTTPWTTSPMDLDQLGYCQWNIRTRYASAGYCAALCIDYWTTQSNMCRGIHNDHGENLLTCVCELNSRYCYDNRLVDA